ncbi:hypothetical protein EJD97_017964 [Solanum chilense]|uniref:Gag-pol polyprotein n=1 Tax=Solanum chilense TaxID=4083 RepID=A0A6N2CEI1_SOLCI|nr:hypothetical protein EJD97_017964 [Solanum chilense]
MNTRRNVARRLEEEIANAGVPPHGAIITQAQAASTQAQAMTTQANREVVPRAHQKVATMDSHLRDFTQMNPHTFYGSKVEEDPQEFIDEIYKILYAMVVVY